MDTLNYWKKKLTYTFQSSNIKPWNSTQPISKFVQLNDATISFLDPDLN